MVRNEIITCLIINIHRIVNYGIRSSRVPAVALAKAGVSRDQADT